MLVSFRNYLTSNCLIIVFLDMKRTQIKFKSYQQNQLMAFLPTFEELIDAKSSGLDREQGDR